MTRCTFCCKKCEPHTRTVGLRPVCWLGTAPDMRRVLLAGKVRRDVEMSGSGAKYRGRRRKAVGP